MVHVKVPFVSPDDKDFMINNVPPDWTQLYGIVLISLSYSAAISFDYFFSLSVSAYFAQI